VSALSVVIAFDIAEGFASGGFDVREGTAFEQLDLEPGPEAFGLGVVVAVAFARQRLPQPFL